ncbi:COX15/CtaA family protein [Paenibacillus sp. GYB003]|uniref:COX15/CtaA family protein n=1 Tax=Paenibacillus sp. GYB003 TaxID=2994392 RepID=UPI002F963026
MMGKRMYGLALASAIGMGLVLFMGALVTKTGSGDGCGTDWPLCNGKFVPAYTIESMIEYSHRFVTGVVGLFVLGAAVGAYMLLRHSKEALLFAYGTLFFTVLQAILGALAVVFPQSDAVMALHFGFSLIAFSSALLLSIGLKTGAYVPRSAKTNGRNGGAIHSAVPKPAIAPSMRKWIWGATVYSYIVVYVGAFVRHTESSGGCLGWPLCNGEVVPGLHGATGIAFAHRVAAALLLVVIAVIAHKATRPSNSSVQLRLASLWALLLTVLQVFSGATVVWTLATDWYLLTALIHVVLVSGMFGVLCYMSVLAWRSARASA